MIKTDQIKVAKDTDIKKLPEKAAKKLRIDPDVIKDITVLKKSVDARNKGNILDVYSLALTTTLSKAQEEKLVKKLGDRNVSVYEKKVFDPVFGGVKKPDRRPVIAGFGPAGIFLALVLSKNGFDPVVVERGRKAQERKKDVERFFETGRLDPDSNVQFGEGGAGTFSDGKLNTLIKDEEGMGRFVLETFVNFGAPENILTDAKPHIGTDKLVKIIPAIREEIIKNGGEIRFETTLTGFDVSENGLCAVYLNDTERIETDTLFLCPGHSARDTILMLKENGVELEAKAFALGVRVEHERQTVDDALHQEKGAYKLTHKCADGRGVYTFCMCPGGQVINASSEEGGLCVNGMSNSERDGRNSNSALVVTVTPDDFGGDASDPLRGVYFQRDLERKAFRLGEGRIPYERFGDFKAGRDETHIGRIEPSCPSPYVCADVRSILPEYVAADITEGIDSFGKKIRGFDDPDTLLAGIETRTSSPVRITRDENYTSNIRGVYPVGEGAGYAGGIMSAAIDAIKCARCYIRQKSV